MNASKFIANTILMSCLMLPTFAVAQGQPTDRADDGSQVQGPVETEGQESVQIAKQNEPEATDKNREDEFSQVRIHMEEPGILQVDGGIPGDRFVIVAGLEETSYDLPGGAKLRLEPLALWGPSYFDANGALTFALQSYGGSSIVPFDFYLQVLILDDDGVWQSSNLMNMHFNGDTLSEIRPVLVRATIPLPANVDALRPDMLA